jgi:hypothetical protein
MPNNSSARRDKNEKKNRRREPTPLAKQVPAEGVESFLSRSSADSGFQDDDENVTWESAAGEAALDNSLSSFSRLPSSAEPKETKKEERARKRKKKLAKELDEESDITLSDDSIDKEDSGSRKLSSLYHVVYRQQGHMSPEQKQFKAEGSYGKTLCSHDPHTGRKSKRKGCYR